MKKILAQLGNPNDSHGAILAEVAALDENCIVAFFEGRYVVGSIDDGIGPNKGRDFPTAQAYCTWALSYDDAVKSRFPNLAKQDFKRACEMLGMPAYIQVLKG